MSSRAISRPKFTTGRLLLAFALVVVICCAAFEFFNNSAHEQKLAALSAAGMPISEAELQQLTGPRDPEASRLYGEARSAMTVDAGLRTRGLNLHTVVESADRQYSRANEDAYRILEEASKLRSPTTMDIGSFEVYDDLAGVPAMRAFIASADGDHTKALQSLKTLDRMTMQLLPVGNIQRNAAYSWVWAYIPKCLLRNVKDNPSALKELRTFLQSRPPLPASRASLLSQYVEVEDGLRRMGAEAHLTQRWRFWGPYKRAALDRDATALTALFHHITGDDFNWKRDQAALAQMRKAMGPLTGTASDYIYRHCEGVRQVMTTAYTTEAVRRMETLCALVLEQRLKDGSVPKAFTAPPDITDPFTGKPFKYKKISDGFIFYTVGPDGVDNGGLMYHATSDDFAFGIQW